MAPNRWLRRAPHSRRVLIVPVMASVACLVAVAGCGSSGGSNSSGTTGTTSMTGEVVNGSSPYAGRPSVTQFCGKKNITLAYVDGFGGNSWRKIVKYEVEQFAKKCSTVKSVTYYDANNDASQYTTDFATLVAQHVSAIMTFDDFGAATFPAIKNAYDHGIPVIMVNVNPGGSPGKDYTTLVSPNFVSAGGAWATWLNSALKGKGNVAFLGGTAGNTQSPLELASYSKKVASAGYSGLNLLTKTPLTTGWNPTGEQSAMVGAISKYSTIDGIMTDDISDGFAGYIKAYENAGKPFPAVAGLASDQQTLCMYRQYKKSHPSLQVYSLDGTTNIGLVALRKAVAAAEGIRDPEADTLDLSPAIDTATGLLPKCVSQLPPDTPNGSVLTTSQLEAALGA